jgi:cellobiose-specific phosphotransferase system component IIC
LKNSDYIYEDDDTERSLPEKVELEMKGSLISGISLTLIGTFILVVHFFGRTLVETKDERTDVLRRLYLIIGLAIFAIVTIISLASAVPETLRYALLDVRAGDESPGEALAISIVALPVWVTYLVLTLRNVRRISDSTETVK